MRRRPWLVLTVALLLLGGAGGGAGWWWFDTNILQELPEDLTDLRTWRPPTAVEVLTADGTVIDQFALERRIWVPLAELPASVPQAFLAAEDRRFYEHRGVDLFGIARAFWTNVQAGDIVQGGSTITQQLVKNLRVGSDKSYERKLKEAVLAVRLERELSKDQILELFVNYVFLGAGNYGVEAAARDYFGVSARALTPGQAALIAGLVPAPSIYNPRRSPGSASERRALVLQAMVEEGYVTPEQAVRENATLVLVKREAPQRDEVSTAYVTEVRRELRRVLGPQVFADGLRVRVPLDLRIQKVAQDAIDTAARGVVERQGMLGPVTQVPAEERAQWLEQASGLVRDPATGTPLKPRVGQCFPGMVGEDGALVLAGPFSWPLTVEAWGTKVRSDVEDAPPKTLAQVVRPGHVLRLCATVDGVALDPDPWVEGAAVVLENATGRVIAVVGGAGGVGLEGFVRATQAERQPGSSFKPYVYAAALAQGHTQTETVLDAPIVLTGTNGLPWSPKNYTGGYAGALPMRSALAQSLNTVSVRLALDVGPQNVAALARTMGVRSPLRDDLTLALGSSEVTPMDQAKGYAAIARLGVPVDPAWIDTIQLADETVLVERGGAVQHRGTTIVLPGGPKPRALDPGVAYELVDMMREVVRAGTARRAFREDQDRAGKTGTTNGFRDAWFVGFTPRYTVAVWIGTDGTRSLGESETGGRAALPAWMTIMDELYQPRGERFRAPPEAVIVPWGAGQVAVARGRTKDPGAVVPWPLVARSLPKPAPVEVMPQPVVLDD